MRTCPPCVCVCMRAGTSTVSSFLSTSSLTTVTGPGAFRWELSFSANVGSGDVLMFVLGAPTADVLVSTRGMQPFTLNTNTFLT